MADTIVTAEKLNEIKTKLNNELKNRRTYTYHGINVNQYQGSAWDFTAVPGREITNDQLHKLIDPMLQINDFMQDNTLIGDKPTTIPDLTTVLIYKIGVVEMESCYLSILMEFFILASDIWNLLLMASRNHTLLVM